GFCVGRLVRTDAVDAFAVDPLGLQCETELLAHDACEKAAHRVPLPAGCLHDRGNCRSLGLAQQRKDGGLFGIRTRCRCYRLMGLVRCVFADRPNREFLDGLSLVACHVGILSSLSDGISRRHHRSPAAGGWPAGQDPRAKPHSELRTVPLCSARNASPFSIILLLVFRRADHGMIMPSDRACRPSWRAPSLPKLRRPGTPTK